MYGVDGIDWDISFQLTGPEVERLLPWLALAGERIPAFERAGIKNVVSGPITHTPDAGFLMGPAPGLKNYWMCVGASIGITQGPGVGKYLAQWMVHGQTEINVAEMDPRRFGPYAPGAYTEARSIDEYHEMYQVRMPGEYRAAGRLMKRTPLYDELDSKGAQWQEVWGWERAQYFSPDGSPEEHSFRRSSAFDAVGEEVRAVRERVGVADLTAFSKFEVTGTDAAALLDRLAANKLPTSDGGLRLTHMLTDLGGIECEMTITRFGHDRFYLNSAIVGEQHDFDWLQFHIEPGEDVSVNDVTNDLDCWPSPDQDPVMCWQSSRTPTSQTGTFDGSPARRSTWPAFPVSPCGSRTSESWGGSCIIRSNAWQRSMRQFRRRVQSTMSSTSAAMR